MLPSDRRVYSVFRLLASLVTNFFSLNGALLSGDFRGDFNSRFIKAAFMRFFQFGVRLVGEFGLATQTEDSNLVSVLLILCDSCAVKVVYQLAATGGEDQTIFGDACLKTF